MTISIIFLFLFIILLCLIIPLILLELQELRNKASMFEQENFLDSNGHHIYYDRSIIEKTHFLLKNPHVHPRELRTLSRFYKEFFQTPSYQKTFGKDN